MTPFRLVIPSEARDLQFAARCRSLTLLGVTKSYEYLRAATTGILPDNPQSRAFR
jgi:hypothetical protein